MAKIPISTEETLSILAWNTCTALCAHCGPESSPKDKTAVSHERVLSLITEAGEIYNPNWCLTLSGGEIFVHYNRLLEYTAAAQKNGGYTTLITNCFWATSVEKAEELLNPLIKNDLRVLGVSADHFHTPYISVEKVKNAIRAARNLNLTVRLRSVASRSGRLSDILKQIEDINPWFMPVMEMPLVPDGRGNNIPESELFLQDAIPTGKCPAASLTINPSGEAMACCNGGGAYSNLQVGNVEESKLEELEYMFVTSPIINYLRNAGPYQCIKYLPQDEQEKVRAKKYVNECHLCIELFSKTKRGNIIREKIEEEFKNSMKNTLVQFTDVLEFVDLE